MQRFKALVLRYADVDQLGFLKYYTKLGDCIIHLAEQGVLSADTISVLGRYIAGLEMGNGQAATEAIKVWQRASSVSTLKSFLRGPHR